MQAARVRATGMGLMSVMLAGLGCVRVAPAVRVVALPAPQSAPPPLPVSPFEDSPVSFLVASPRFTRGELVIVRVCVGPDRSISSADILESSGDRRFDALAVGWARQVRLRSAPTADVPVAPCGQVRVEVP